MRLAANFPWVVTFIGVLTGAMSTAQTGILCTISLFGLAISGLITWVERPTIAAKAALVVSGGLVALLIVAVPFASLLDILVKVFA